MPSPEFERVLSVMRAMPRVDSATIPIQTMRDGFELQMSMMAVRRDAMFDLVDAGGVKAEWTRTTASKDESTIFYLHGGGYCLGSPTTHHVLVTELCEALGSRALSVDYRLAPEHPHPAAVDDAIAAYRWMLDSGVSPESVVIAGDSAGGGLAFATLVAARDRGLPLPRAAVTFSPWVDLEGIGESMSTKAAEDPMIQKVGLERFGRAYAGTSDIRAPLAAPLYADLSGLPPTLIQVGTAEVLLDDSRRIAHVLEARGVSVTLQVYDGMVHVFQTLTMIPEAREAIAKVAEFVRSVPGGGGLRVP